MSEALTTKVDSEGRITLPAKVREALKVGTGDVFYIHIRVKDKMVQLALAPNPLEADAAAGPWTARLADG